MGTTLSDVIVPEIFTPYTIKRTMELSALVQSGIVVNSPEFDKLASEAASIHNMPFFADLTGDASDVIEGQDLTAQKIESKKDQSATFRRAQMWSATDLSAQLAGADPMKAIGTLVGAYWARELQKDLLATLKGVFGAATMKQHVLDISGSTGRAAVFSASSFIDACQLLGDSKANLTAVVMHSATHALLLKNNLLETERDSMNVEFDTYQGRRVIIDDGCPVEGGVYTSFLFGSGAIALGNGSPVGFVPTETDRDKRKGSGVDYLINRRVQILHPRGVKFTATTRANIETVSRAEMSTATNWELVYEPKQIRMVAFKHKIV